MAFPVVYLVSALVIFDVPSENTVPMVLSPFFIFLSICCMAAGYGLWEMRRWSWYVLAFADVLIGYENIVVLIKYAQTHHKFMSFGLHYFLVLVMFYRVSREVRVPWFLPRIKWWESNARYQLSVPVRIALSSGESFRGRILDLSVGGCYVKLKEEVNENERVEIHFKVFGQSIVCNGITVWQTQPTVTRPKGVGIRFEDSSKELKRVIRVTVKRLRRINSYFNKVDADDESMLTSVFEEDWDEKEFLKTSE